MPLTLLLAQDELSSSEGPSEPSADIEPGPVGWMRAFG